VGVAKRYGRPYGTKSLNYVFFKLQQSANTCKVLKKGFCDDCMSRTQTLESGQTVQENINITHKFQ